MRICTLDLETFYSQDYSLSKMSTEAYIRDPRFEIIGLGIKFENYPTDWFGGERANDTQLRYLLGKHDWSETLILCHNTQFDGAILSWKFGIKPAGWLDTLSMARALHGVDVGGSLGYLSEKYGLGKKGTEVLDALGKRRHHFTDEEMARYGEYCKNDVELTRKLFDKLMAAGFPQKELKVIDTTLRMFIEPRLELDQPLLHAHLKDVQDAKAASIDKLWQEIIQNPTYAQTVLPDSFAQEGGKLEALKPLLMSNPQFAAVLRDFGVEPPMKVSPTTGKETFAFAKTDEGFKALLEHDDVVVQALAAARLGVKSTLEETRTQTFIETAKRGVFPVPLKYYGARTGRWSGEVYNLQNLPRSSKLKKAIKAPAGMALIGADLSNIELRMGLWLSGQHDKLKMLGDGLDLYKDFASAVFGVAYDAVTKDQRFIGKTSQLSLIYGVGAAKLRAAIKAGSGVDIGEAESKRIVALYRRDYAKVAAAWGDGERALQAILSDQTMLYGHNGVVQVDGTDGAMLPSGLRMHYPQLSRILEDGKAKWVYKTRKGTEYLYGAKFFQGITQALARIVMAEDLLRVSKRYFIALTVHDALYCLAPETEAESAVAFVLSEMRKPPKWAPDIPLDAEAGYGPTLADC